MLKDEKNDNYEECLQMLSEVKKKLESHAERDELQELLHQ